MPNNIPDGKYVLSDPSGSAQKVFYGTPLYIYEDCGLDLVETNLRHLLSRYVGRSCVLSNVRNIIRHVSYIYVYINVYFNLSRYKKIVQ